MYNYDRGCPTAKPFAADEKAWAQSRNPILRCFCHGNRNDYGILAKPPSSLRNLEAIIHARARGCKRSGHNGMPVIIECDNHFP